MTSQPPTPYLKSSTTCYTILISYRYRFSWCWALIYARWQLCSDKTSVVLITGLHHVPEHSCRCRLFAVGYLVFNLIPFVGFETNTSVYNRKKSIHAFITQAPHVEQSNLLGPGSVLPPIGMI